MSNWPTVKAKKVLNALFRISWRAKRQTGSHIILHKDGLSNYVWAFRDYEEIGPKMLARIAKKTDLRPKNRFAKSDFLVEF